MPTSLSNAKSRMCLRQGVGRVCAVQAERAHARDVPAARMPDIAHACTYARACAHVQCTCACAWSNREPVSGIVSPLSRELLPAACLKVVRTHRRLPFPGPHPPSCTPPLRWHMPNTWRACHCVLGNGHSSWASWEARRHAAANAMPVPHATPTHRAGTQSHASLPHFGPHRHNPKGMARIAARPPVHN